MPSAPFSNAFIRIIKSIRPVQGNRMIFTLAEYFVRVAQYFPPYVGAALIYAVAGAAIVKLFKLLPEMWANHKSV